jgi:hypothetical protein
MVTSPGSPTAALTSGRVGSALYGVSPVRVKLNLGARDAFAPWRRGPPRCQLHMIFAFAQSV